MTRTLQPWSGPPKYLLSWNNSLNNYSWLSLQELVRYRTRYPKLGELAAPEATLGPPIRVQPADQ